MTALWDYKEESTHIANMGFRKNHLSNTEAEPGVARQQVSFFCFAKRKKPKKRRPAQLANAVGPSGYPVLLNGAGRCGTRFAEVGVPVFRQQGRKAQTVLAEYPFASFAARRLTRDRSLCNRSGFEDEQSARAAATPVRVAEAAQR